MTDGHEYDPTTMKCRRCSDPWPCAAERAWNDMRATLQQAAFTELLYWQEKRINAQ